MKDQEKPTTSRRFGAYLRRVRESRRLSLDAVEELSAGMPERLTKSHLSRIENGRAVPTFPRLFTLSRIYGVPVASLAERFEIELQRDLAAPDIEGKTEDEIHAEAKQLAMSGRYSEALSLYSAALDRLRSSGGESSDGSQRTAINLFRLREADCLVHLSRYESAKIECEEILNEPDLSVREKLIALELFIQSCVGLGRFTVAVIALDAADHDVGALEDPGRFRPDLAMLRGNVLVATGRASDAPPSFLRALRFYDELPDRYEACRTRVNLGYALIEAGKEREATAQLTQALGTARKSGYERLEALALSNLAVLHFHQNNLDQAEAYAIRSNAIARPREFVSVVFRNCFYLWKIALSRGDRAGIVANERALRTYAGRVEDHMPEVESYRLSFPGGKS